MSFSLPNFYFHATTAYDILRTNGVPLGKRDFMGRLKMKKLSRLRGRTAARSGRLSRDRLVPIPPMRAAAASGRREGVLPSKSAFFSLPLSR